MPSNVAKHGDIPPQKNLKVRKGNAYNTVALEDVRGI